MNGDGRTSVPSSAVIVAVDRGEALKMKLGLGHIGVSAVVLALSMFGQEAMSATLTGRITNENGRPVPGVLVSLFNAEKDRKETVYSDAEGRYALQTDFTGALMMRARSLYFQDSASSINVEDDSSLIVDFTLKRLTSPQALSDSFSASAHSAQLKWGSKDRKTTFISQCHFCHQIGNEQTRQPRDRDEWGELIDRMEGYSALITPWDQWAFEKTLAGGFDGKPIKAEQSIEISSKLYKAKFKEWQVGDGFSFIHDVAVGSDGRLYGVDQGHDVVWELDRETGKLTRHQMPDSELPQGGLFSGVQLPIGIFTGKHGPHSLVESDKGKFWITGSLSSTLISFDIKTKKFEVHEVGGDALYPHTIRRDAKGIMWFTLPASNQIGRFDPRTEKFTLIETPSNGFGYWLTDALFPTILKIASWFPKKNLHLWLSHHWSSGLGRKIMNFPYGIDVHPRTGDIWYSKLYSNKIGRIDPNTLKVTEFDTPMTGPRRLRFDKNGILWIPSFNEGGLMRFDPGTGKFRVFKLPKLASNEYEVPYALNIHPQTGDVWIATNQSDRILRFSPTTNRFISYPSPTRVTFLRDLVFTKDGEVCSSHSNLPAHAIEGGRPAFLCIDP